MRRFPSLIWAPTNTAAWTDSIRWICERPRLDPELHFAGGDRGWIGDNPYIFLDCSRMRGLGWRPKLTIQQSVIRTVEYLQANQHILAAR